MKHRRASKSALFLMELLIAILVFALTAAICMRIFTFAKLTADSAGDLSIAVTNVQNAAECYKAYHGDLNLTAQALGYDGVMADGYFEYTITDNLTLKLISNTDSSVNECDIIVYTESGDEVYSIVVNAFVPEVN